MTLIQHVRSLVSRITALVALLRSVSRPDAVQCAIRDGLRKSTTPPDANASRIVVAAIEDAFYFGLFGEFCRAVLEHATVRVDLYQNRSHNPGEGKSWPWFLYTRLITGRLRRIKWRRLYSSYTSGNGFSSTSFAPIADLVDLARAWRFCLTKPTREAILGLSVQGIPVGDLVNDTYLRFKPAPTIGSPDLQLLLVVWQARREARRATRYFDNAVPTIMLSSYATYVQHGVAVRAALKFGARVITCGNNQQSFKELTVQDWLHTKNTRGYASDFSLLVGQEEKLACAKELIQFRLGGGVDLATSYMASSAYAARAVKVPDLAGCVVVFLHDFFDSPHIYHGMVFPDFWQWICLTIETLEGAGIPFVLKKHPNQIASSNEVVADLQSRYPSARFISEHITNVQLVAGGMICGVTIYGTVAHELAYLGIPSIGCAQHPHVSFGFCRTARSVGEYQTLLQVCNQPETDPDLLRLESLRFIYMHNLDHHAETRVLLKELTELRSLDFATDGQDPAIPRRLIELAALPAFRALASDYAHFLSGSQRVRPSDQLQESPT